MGCLSISALRIGEGIHANANRIGKPIQCEAEILNKRLNISAHLVCTINKSAFLNVVPDVVWLTPDMLSGEFDIYSNVVWRID